ncbi:NADPH-dependent 7-cyano-7-deazaguanine reductase QueF [Massilia dura]|uniref:NADPH-dependent 7-cyano-7-deazaguanine reductase n=1 Tax=Pseudoduganella dura TaxID=321982 RepID=A0A6I3XMN9_9BURK|nr:NADPH-dependent 7-cyano-7-deazaguanine reductase QueF [Pseudoduganella dura]MUI12995.1 NADPH-dependent 7-cyano-7-deazaguanine reductase QueF [Pseudoduganella dura]GGX88036.1 NADPH-dependent 7-cyano-7-deazaguanine reductase [Pseudoduganella dura]
MSNAPEHSPLGKNSAYRTDYAPELLFPIPRIGKRDELGLSGTLPFFGVDLWNAYELSWLNMRGKPQVAVARITVPADSPNIIESKSFKLYLNSFNQTRLGGPEALRDLLQQDLSAATGANVHVVLTMQEEFGKLQMGELEGMLLDRLDIEVDNYSPQPSILRANFDELPVEETLVSHLLKSNCLVTGQPDWGSVQITYAGPQIDQESLLKYLIGFREHNEFHEQCVERIFVDILRECKPSHLTVYARYTRRGGLDINPWRSNFTRAGRPTNFRNARQ